MQQQPSTLHDDLRAALRKYWGHGEFRPMQLETIESVCAGRDTLSLMPTGAGKSLIYQLPTLVRKDGFCIVVTPLIALMKDQVDKLRARGISAVAVHSGMSAEQIDGTLDRCVYGDVKFLYVAPERIASDMFRLRLPRMNPTLIAVDEAHCISQWGYDFRPSYLRIAEIRAIVPHTPILALTASATDIVAEDIMDKLRMVGGRTIRSSFERSNLSYSVRPTEDKGEQLLRVARGIPGTGIVYARTREGVEKLAEWLTEQGIEASSYHGGMDPAQRTARQEEWIAGRKRIMVATNAFGMGIDKADVRFVVHWSIPDSIEHYYQETGRAGRDGLKAYAVLLTAPDDRMRAGNRFSNEYPSLAEIKEIYEAVMGYVQVAMGEGREYSFDFNVYDFCRSAGRFSGTVLNAIKILQANGYMVLTDESDHPARVMFRVSRDDLYRLRVERDELDHFLRTVMRMYNGIFTEFRPVIETEIASRTGYTLDRVRELFKTLWQLRVISYIPSRRTPLLYLPVERLPLDDIYIAPATYKIRKDLAAGRIEQIFAYALQADECRSVWLRRYFGEGGDGVVPCGVCDGCVARRKAVAVALSVSGASDAVSESAILTLLETGGLTVKELVRNFAGEPAEILAVLDGLIAAEKVAIDPTGVVKLTTRKP
ncbi:MAG: RecQ family ATP-dependent DNA helicase [Alistipes sp.]|jgi:ATP-dependent DNA helicase RecQ|nr:RecQ family ATP-dependent DNA helicase [Alistipes sp.]